MTLKRLGEFGLISRIRARLKYRSGQTLLGIGDDCAVYKPAQGKRQIVTSDALTEDVHFKKNLIPPARLGYKALAVNVSDIAAMGGTPRLALLTLGIPANCPLPYLNKMLDGFLDACAQFKVELVGGDTVSSPKNLFISVTLIGDVSKDRLFTRKGARPGDGIFVTGSLGNSALGLKLLTGEKTAWKGSKKDIKFLIDAHLSPIPRLKESGALSRSKAKITSMLDLSDGLAGDLAHICQAGGVGARLCEDRLPRSPAFTNICAANKLSSDDLILGGGEDYELLFTSPPKDAKKISGLFRKAGSPVSHIGEITARPGEIVWVRSNGRESILPRSQGYDHFKS